MDSVEKKIEQSERVVSVTNRDGLTFLSYDHECDMFVVNVPTPGDEKHFARALVNLAEYTRDALLASERRQEWIKVTPETMPKVGQRCLVVWCDHVQSCAYVWNGRDFQLPESLEACIGGDDLPGDQAQYWQPLPTVPEER